MHKALLRNINGNTDTTYASDDDDGPLEHEVEPVSSGCGSGEDFLPVEDTENFFGLVKD